MKFKTLFLVPMFLLAACETTNVYPTKVVEVQTETPATVVVTQTVTKIDCASIDPSFEQVGDTCVSICVACIKNGGQCLDTNKNGYGDTCVSPAPECPMMPYYQDLDGDGYGDLSTAKMLCSGIGQTGWIDIAGDCNNNNATVYPGADELCDSIDNDCDGSTDEDYEFELGKPCYGLGQCGLGQGTVVCSKEGEVAQLSCSVGTPATGYTTPDAPELCDSIDNNCNGQTDEGCATAPNPNDDNDNDGFIALDDCDDNDASVQPGFANCPNLGVTKYSYKLVLVWGNKADANWPYKNTLKYKQELSFVGGGYNTTDLTGSNWDSWQGAEFDKGTFVAIDLDPAVKFIRFNEFEYPGKWMICNAAKVNDTSVDFNTLNLPTMYVVKSGVWENVTAKIGMQAALDTMSNGPMPKSTSPSGYPQLNYCSATLTF